MGPINEKPGRGPRPPRSSPPEPGRSEGNVQATTTSLVLPEDYLRAQNRAGGGGVRGRGAAVRRQSWQDMGTGSGLQWRDTRPPPITPAPIPGILTHRTLDSPALPQASTCHSQGLEHTYPHILILHVSGSLLKAPLPFAQTTHHFSATAHS